MNKKNKLKKVVKQIQGFRIRISQTNGFAVYAGKKLLADKLKTIEEAESKIKSIL